MMAPARVAAALALAMLAACRPSPQEPVTIMNAWSPATPPSATVAAAYMRISVRESDVLLAATTPVAESVEMHTTIEEGGMMRMRPLEELAIAAGETASFEPGGRHFMLVGLHAPLAAGATAPMTLRFQHAGDIDLEITVKAPGAARADH